MDYMKVRNTQMAAKQFFSVTLCLTTLFLLSASGSGQEPTRSSHPVVVNGAPPAYATQQFSLDAKGALKGQVRSINESPLTVFVVENNEVVATTEATPEGSFSITGIQPGRYSIVAAGQQEFAAQGLIVKPAETSEIDQVLELTTISTSYSGILDLIKERFIQQISSKLTGQQGSQSSMLVSQKLQSGKKVRIINQGLRGTIETSSTQVSEQNSNIQIHLFQNSRPIAHVIADSVGYFVIPDVTAGIYDLVAVSQQGLVATRIEAVDSNGGFQQVAFSSGISNQIQLPLAQDLFVQDPVNNTPGLQNYPTNDLYLEPSLNSVYSAPIEYAGESITYGGAGGATAGNNGNFSNFSNTGNVIGRGRFGGRFGRLGGGRLGRILSVTALGGAITAIADDENPLPASPVQ